MMVWGYNQFIYGVFVWFSLVFKVFIIIHDYLCTWNEKPVSKLCLSFNLVSSLVVAEI